MKLSMWMIANRLSGFDIETEIEPRPPVVLKSARRAYATDCVYIYQENGDAVCKGRGGKITLRNMDAQMATVIVQSIFDFFNDWDDAIHDAFRKKPPDYQKVIDISDGVFKNPILISDANFRVLGISKQYAADAVDDEWYNLVVDGYHSVMAVKALFMSNYDFSLPQAHVIRADERNPRQTDSIAMPIFHNNMHYGRFVVICHSNPATMAYVQLAEHVAAVAASIMSTLSNDDSSNDDKRSWFLSLIERNSISEPELIKQLKYYDWNPDDVYYLSSLRLKNESARMTFFDNQFERILHKRVKCISVQHKGGIVLLTSSAETGIPELVKQVKSIFDSDDMLICLSLPFAGLKNIPEYYMQTEIAYRHAIMAKAKTDVSDYYCHALDDQLLAPLTEKSIHSCHPDIRMLREYDSQNNTEYLPTLHTFLKYERSIVSTAQELFIHRNTLVYRIKKITEIMKYDIEDAYARMYMLNSIRVLELMECMGLIS